MCWIKTAYGFQGFSRLDGKIFEEEGLRNVKLHGECASANKLAAHEYPAVLRDIIKEGEYTPYQIYSLDETALYYRLMPKPTYISRMHKQVCGRNLDKAKINVMFTVNLSESYKMASRSAHCCSPKVL